MAYNTKDQHRDYRFLYTVAGFVLATQFFTIVFLLLPQMN